MALHKDNVFIDLSGWSPKYFSKQIITYANSQLKHKMMFGSDFPLITPEKWIEAAQGVGFRRRSCRSSSRTMPRVCWGWRDTLRSIRNTVRPELVEGAVLFC